MVVCLLKTFQVFNKKNVLKIVYPDQVWCAISPVTLFCLLQFLIHARERAKTLMFFQQPLAVQSLTPRPQKLLLYLYTFYQKNKYTRIKYRDPTYNYIKMLGAATITVMMLMVVCVVVLLISAVDSHCVRDMSQFNFVSRTKRLGNCRLQESENGVPAGR